MSEPADGTTMPELVIVTGMSGAGRSTAGDVLEDLGWFVVDNLPPGPAPDPGRARRPVRRATVPRIAAVVDVRGRQLLRRPARRAARGPGRQRRDARGIVFLEAVRRGPGPPLRAVAPPAPAAGRRPDHRRHRRRAACCSPTCAATPTSSSTRPRSTSTSCGPRSRTRSPAPYDPACAPRSCPSATSTACRSTPTSSSTAGSCPTRTGCPSCGRSPASTPRSATTSSAQPGAEDVPRPLRPASSRLIAPGYLREGKRYVTRRRRLHRRQAPQRRDGRGARRAGCGRSGHRDPRRPPRPGAGVTAPDGPAVVALGGGHGLAASLSALRQVTGSSRPSSRSPTTAARAAGCAEELGVLPPGDLRMALAALCGDDEWGRTWSDVLQHRFAGDGDLPATPSATCSSSRCGSACTTPVDGLDWVARLLGAQGRVLPDGRRAARDRGRRRRRRRRPSGDQRGPRPGRGRDGARAASSPSRLLPPAPPACPEARGRRRRGRLGRPRPRLVVHLGHPAPARARPARGAGRDAAAQTVVVLNLRTQPGETDGLLAGEPPRGPRRARAGSAGRRGHRRPGRGRRPRAAARTCAASLGAELVARTGRHDRRHAASRPRPCSPAAFTSLDSAVAGSPHGDDGRGEGRAVPRGRHEAVLPQGRGVRDAAVRRADCTSSSGRIVVEAELDTGCRCAPAAPRHRRDLRPRQRDRRGRSRGAAHGQSLRRPRRQGRRGAGPPDRAARRPRPTGARAAAAGRVRLGRATPRPPGAARSSPTAR